MADTFTVNYNLTKPADGDTNWGVAKLNPNLDTIDTQIKNRESEIAGHINKASGTHGVSGNSFIVGTQETQTLFNKTFGNTTEFNGAANFNSTITTLGQVTIQGALGGSLQLNTGANIQVLSPGTIIGNGSGITTLNASNLTTGTVDDLRLSSNVPFLNKVNAFSGASFSGGVTFNQGLTTNSTLTANSSMLLSFRNIASTTTLSGNDCVVNCTSGTFTITLPFTQPGRYIVIKNSGVGTITVQGSIIDGATLDGSASKTVTTLNALRLTGDANNNNWILV